MGDVARKIGGHSQTNGGGIARQMGEVARPMEGHSQTNREVDPVTFFGVGLPLSIRQEKGAHWKGFQNIS